MKNAVMYGAGNIGRGFIGQLFSLSGYEVTFIDINEAVIDKLQSDRSYPLYITRGEEYEKTEVKNVTGLLGKDPEVVGDMIAKADVMATAVGVNVLPYIAKPIACGVKRRFENGNKTPLNIIICENKLGADSYLRELVSQNLNDEEKEYFNEYFGLVEASIGRMVPATPDEIRQENMLAVCVEEYCQLPVDKAAFKGEIPEIVNLMPFEPFEFFIQRKLFMHNMSHALTAYLGALNGCEYIWQAALDPSIKLLAFQALIESSQALSKEHGVDISELIEHSEDLLYRFENKLLGDTSLRVGRDTIRKLSKHDRLVGAHNLCKKQGIKPVYICLGIAAALLFCPADDAASVEVSNSAKAVGVAETLKKYSELEDAESIALIEKLYDMLSQKAEMKDIITLLEIEKRK